MTDRAIAYSVLDTAAVPPERRFSLFQAGLGVSHEANPLSEDTAFSARLEAWMMAGMMVTSGHQGASRIVRDETRARLDGLDHLTFMHLIAGEVAGRASRPLQCTAGQTFVLDAASAMSVETTANRNIGVRLSRNALIAAGIDPNGLNGLVLDGAIGRVVGAHFAALVRHAFLVRAEDAPVLERATVALLAECLQDVGGREYDRSRYEMRRRAAEHVERHLADPDLDGAGIAKAIGVSRSGLYRVFPGGIDRYIAARRLDGAIALLADTGDGRSVAEIALAVGFADPNYFSSAFRRRFGATASQVRRYGPTTTYNGLPHAYRRWLAALCDNSAG